MKFAAGILSKYPPQTCRRAVRNGSMAIVKCSVRSRCRSAWRGACRRRHGRCLSGQCRWALMDKCRNFFKTALNFAEQQMLVLDFMVYGELLDELQSLNPVPDDTTEWSYDRVGKKYCPQSRAPYGRIPPVNCRPPRSIMPMRRRCSFTKSTVCREESLAPREMRLLLIQPVASR